MLLQELLRELSYTSGQAIPSTEIAALTADSRQVVPGGLFVAVHGESLDGHQFLGEAMRRGAGALVGEQPDPHLGVPYIRVPDSRLALALLASAWHAHPSRSLVLIGVTGTDGKTTTCHLLFEILRAAGLRAGMVTSVSAQIGDRTSDTGFHVTTPDPLQLQGYLADMVREGLSHVVLEVTSHGLAQRRVGGCEFDIAVLTNVTHEHLDYHGSFDAYLQAKGMLFSGLTAATQKPRGPQKTTVLNRDDDSFAYLRGITAARCVSYGLGPEADLHARNVEHGAQGLQFTARWQTGEQRIDSHLVGLHNVHNALAAFAASVIGLQLSPEDAARGIASLPGVPGRMEAVDLGQDFQALVDFAHTPNALRRALEAARTLTQGRVIVVFGCAGLRDRQKRPMMGGIAAELADWVVITAEDPRSEPLESILDQIATGVRARGGVEGSTFWRVPDRAESLRVAAQRAGPGDLIIVCGKGHEQSMCFGEIEHPWDDRLALRAAIAERMGVPGPAMPRLPTS